MQPDRSQTPDRQQHVLAILAIATASIGVALFGGGLNLISLEGELTGLLLFLTIAKSFAVLAAVFLYFSVFISVIRITAQDRPVSGREVAYGPLLWLYWEMFFLALIFLANAYESFFL